MGTRPLSGNHTSDGGKQRLAYLFTIALGRCFTDWGKALSIKFLIRRNGRQQFETDALAEGLHTQNVIALLRCQVKKTGGAFVPASAVSVQVIPADEELTIATSVCGVLGLGSNQEN